MKKIVLEEGIKEISPDGVEEVLRYAVVRSGSRKKVNVIFGLITDLLREADVLSEGRRIEGRDVKRAMRRKFGS